MNHLLAKIKGRGDQFYKVMSQADVIFDVPDLNETKNFDPNYKLEEDEWFKIRRFSTLGYSNSLIESVFNSTNYSQLPKNKYSEISYFCSKQGGYYLFQKMLSGQIMGKKWFHITDEPSLKRNKPIIILNPWLDAVYDSNRDVLYFREFSKLKQIFKGIDELYREATHEEVEGFLANNFISLQDGYSAEKVKSANRKRIALAIDTLNSYSASEARKIFRYIREYCTEVPYVGNAFHISNEDHLKQVLYGIEQRYYTTSVGNRRRLANSVLEIG